eukprot:2777793-Amphidinium_carterae.1
MSFLLHAREPACHSCCNSVAFHALSRSRVVVVVAIVLEECRRPLELLKDEVSMTQGKAE